MISKEQLRKDLEEYYSTGQINKKFGPYNSRERASDIFKKVMAEELENTDKNGIPHYDVNGGVKEESDGFYVVFQIKESQINFKKGSK